MDFVSMVKKAVGYILFFSFLRCYCTIHRYITYYSVLCGAVREKNVCKHILLLKSGNGYTLKLYDEKGKKKILYK